MMTSAQVVETSVTTTDNSPSQDYTHPDDQTTLLEVFYSYLFIDKVLNRTFQLIISYMLHILFIMKRI